MHVFSGDPKAIGLAYGKSLEQQIRRNLELLIWPKGHGPPPDGHTPFAEDVRRKLETLIWREGYRPLPRQEPAFQAWQRGQEGLIRRHWPWMLEEMAGVAEAVGADYEDILLLNLRAWQYNYYGADPGSGACTSLAITLSDGTVASAGALDDSPELYCGPVKFEPDRGHRFISFPIAGTGWAGRGMNDAGLALGSSSQLLPGLRRKAEATSQDLAARAILQTCQTVADVRALCIRHPFTMNMICVDAAGGVLCAQNTAAGLLELPWEGFAAQTNNIVRDEDIHWLYRQGVTEFPEATATRIRRGAVLAFCRERNGACTAEEVRRFVAAFDSEDKGGVHGPLSIVLTLCNPQVAPRVMWMLEGYGAAKEEKAFEAVAL